MSRCTVVPQTVILAYLYNGNTILSIYWSMMSIENKVLENFLNQTLWDVYYVTKKWITQAASNQKYYYHFRDSALMV